MPIYEYECTSCGHRMEAIQKISDEPLKDCPNCSKPDLKKLISASAFRLKGGGWYETDFKAGKKKNLVESGKSEGADKGEKKEKKDGKPGAKSGDSGATPAGKTTEAKSVATGEK